MVMSLKSGLRKQKFVGTYPNKDVLVGVIHDADALRFHNEKRCH